MQRILEVLCRGKLQFNIIQSPLLVIEEPIRRGVLLDLTLTYKERLTGELKVEGSIVTMR